MQYKSTLQKMVWAAVPIAGLLCRHCGTDGNHSANTSKINNMRNHEIPCNGVQ